MRITKSDWSVCALIVILSLVLWLFQEPITQSSFGIEGIMMELASTYGYLGAFVVSLFGNFTILFPIPYIIVIFTLGSLGGNPVVLGVLGGIGATIGEFSAYVVGKGIGMTELAEKYGERLEGISQLIKDKGFFAIFFFAITPIPDDIILVPLGMINYPYRKTLAAMFMGKTLLVSLTAFAGLFYVAGLEWATLLIGEATISNIYTIVLQMVAIILASYLTIRLDWIKIIRKLEQLFKSDKQNNS